MIGLTEIWREIAQIMLPALAGVLLMIVADALAALLAMLV